MQDRLVNWTGDLSKFSAERKLHDMHLILFDSHKRDLAKKFLSLRPTSMVLLESDGLHAANQKQFVNRYLSSHPVGGNGDGVDAETVGQQCKLEAYHANMRDLLVPSKSKPFNKKFLQTILAPDDEYFLQQDVDESDVKTVIVGMVPSPSLQLVLMRSLFKQYVTYLHSLRVGNGYHHQVSQVYWISRFSMLTFFNTDVFAQLLCGRDDCEDLRFFTKTHQHFSFLLNTLFDVRLPNGREGFPLDCFRPNLEDVHLKSHEANLAEVGLPKNHFYPLCFRPRELTELEAMMSRAGIHDVYRSLVPLVFWMELTAKVRNSKQCNQDLREILHDHSLELFPSEVKGAQVKASDFFQRFRQIEPLIFRASGELGVKYRTFLANFFKEESKDHAD